MYIVPAHLLNPDPVRAGIVPKVISGGTALNDDETIIQTDGGGRWEITWGEIDLDDAYLRRLWDAWASYLAGGARTVLVPVLSLETAPRPAAGHGYAEPSDIIADDDYFPSTVAFASPYIVAETVGDAVLRATTLTIDVTRGSRVQPGMKFGVDGRSYIIERVTARDGQEATCIISPPLRAPIDDATALNFDWPVVQCRAVLGQDLIPSISIGQYGSISVAFIEDFSAGEA